MWLHVRIYIYNIICIYVSVKMAAPWGSLALLSFHSLCLHLRSHLTKWDVFQNIRFRNTKPAQSLSRTFSNRNSRKKNRSDDKMAAPKASVQSINQSINIIRMLKSPVLGVVLYIQIRQTVF